MSLELAAGRRVEMDRARLELRWAFGAVFETRLRAAGRKESIERGVLACH
jgi:hypothetical protein